jgi:CBS domain containing-hemolysin-like protein
MIFVSKLYRYLKDRLPSQRALATSSDPQEEVSPHVLQVREAMIPRADICALPKTASHQELLSLLTHKNFEAVLIFEETLDTVVGLVRATALLEHEKDQPWQECIETAVFISPSMPFQGAFEALNERAQPFLVVVDEYGGVDGIVTKSGLLGFLFKKLAPVVSPQHLNTKRFSLFEGRLPLDRFRALFPDQSLEVPESLEDEVTTLGGFVCYLEGAVPTKGSVIDYKGLSFKILDADARKINHLMVFFAQPAQSPQP